MIVLCVKNGKKWCAVKPDRRMRDPRYTKQTWCDDHLVRIGGDVQLEDREPDCPLCLEAISK